MTDLRHLRYFLAVARHLHFTRAAEELHVAQPAVSQSVRQLEKELGVVLFDRTTRGVVLTPVGHVLVSGAQRCLREFDVALDEVASFAGLVTGKVRLGAWQSMEVRLPDLIVAFTGAHPAVSLEIAELTSDAMLDGVRSGTLDVAFVVQHGEPTAMSGLHSDVFITEPYQLAVAEDHPAAGRKKVPLGDLADEPFILHRRGSAVREAILAACAEAGFRPRIALETGEMSAARAFAAAGLGVTILPQSSLLSPGPAVTSIELTPELTRTSAMVWPQERNVSSAALAFREFTREHKALLAQPAT